MELSSIFNSFGFYYYYYYLLLPAFNISYILQQRYITFYVNWFNLKLIWVPMRLFWLFEMLSFLINLTGRSKHEIVK